ncbi:MULTISPECIES: hypothetical protein [unclassified Microcoleus]
MTPAPSLDRDCGLTAHFMTFGNIFKIYVLKFPTLYDRALVIC